MAARNVSDPDLRRAAVDLALAGERPRKEIAEEFGITVSTLARWVRQEREDEAPAPEISAHCADLAADLIRGSDFAQYCDGTHEPARSPPGRVYARQAATEAEVAFTRLENGSPAAGLTDGYAI